MRKDRAEINRLALSSDHRSTGLRGKAIRGGFINIVAQGMGVIVQLLSSAILARLLLPSDYGLVAMAYTVVALAGMLTNLGLTTPTIQRNDITQEQVSTLFYINIIGGIIIFAFAAAVSPLFSYMFEENLLVYLIIIFSLTIPIGAMAAQFSAILMRNMLWVKIQAIQLSSQIVSAIIAILLAWLAHWRVEALIAQVLTSSFMSAALTFLFCPWRPSWTFRLAAVRSELAMGLDLVLFTLLNYGHRQMDNIIIGARWGPVELGLYSRGYNILQQAGGVLTGPLSNALIPGLSAIGEDRDRWRTHFLEAASIVAIISGMLFVVLRATVGEVVTILYGERWLAVIPILSSLLLAGLVTSVCSPFGWVFMSLGHTRRQLYWIVFASPILVLAFWIGSAWGAAGVALAYALTIFVINLLYIYVAVRSTPITYREGVLIVLPIYLAFGLGIFATHLMDGLVPSAGLFSALILHSIGASCSYAAVISLFCLVMPSYRRAAETAIETARLAATKVFAIRASI